ncbi:MAG: cytochrome c biogenesis CcdA family protein [Ilumatobacteraceae bacterium]
MGLSFLKGLVASVNPCAFVLLPTYLAFFVGVGADEAVSRPAAMRRALVVSGSVSAGFMAVFVGIGLLSEYVTRWVLDQAGWLTLVVAIAFVGVGVAMSAGRRLPISTPRMAVDRIGPSVGSMAVYGVAYAVSSISCTLPLFMSTMIGNGRRDGFGSGVAHVVAYGAGMALVVTSLTVAIAAARTNFVDVVRRGSRYAERIGGALVIASGLYLLHYVWVVDVNEGSSPVSDAVQTLQQRIQVSLNDHWQIVAAVLGSVVALALVDATRRRTRQR